MASVTRLSVATSSISRVEPLSFSSGRLVETNSSPARREPFLPKAMESTSPSNCAIGVARPRPSNFRSVPRSGQLVPHSSPCGENCRSSTRTSLKCLKLRVS